MPTINSSNIFLFVGIAILSIGLLVLFYKKTIKNTHLKPIFYGTSGVLLTITLNKILLRSETGDTINKILLRSGAGDTIIGLFLLIIVLTIYFII